MSVSRSFLQYYQWLAGFADTATGICLLVAPILTMRMLDIEVSERVVPYLSYIGTFVLGIGVSYFLCGELANTETSRARWDMTWRITATCRSLVALFLVWQISLGRLPIQWGTVAVTDGALAGFQWLGLQQGWLEAEVAP